MYFIHYNRHLMFSICYSIGYAVRDSLNNFQGSHAGMPEQRIVRARSSDIRHVFEQWLIREWAAGARFVILEGLMGSGKSMLTKQPFALGALRSTNIALDKFLRAPVNPDVEYMAAMDIDAATTTMKQAIWMSPLVVAEGPMGWPVAKGTLQEVPAHHVRRAYLKRMSARNPDDWANFEFLKQYDRPTAYGRSIDRYHATEQPWLLADMVFERIGGDEE